MLERVLQAGRDTVDLVVCQPDRPQGRGRKPSAPPVKRVAEARGIPVVQPVRLRDGQLAQQIRDASIDLGVVVAYGRILPKDLFEAPTFDTVNVHASILPRHRGAAPIQHALLAGDAETGVTLMKLTEGLDEGPMLYVRSTSIQDQDTTGSLFLRLGELGAESLLEGLARAKSEGLAVVEQDPSKASFSPPLTKQDGQLDLTGSAVELDRRCRAVHPWPGAYLVRPDGPLKIHRASPVLSEHLSQAERSAPPGTILSISNGLRLACGEGALDVWELQPPGRKPMNTEDFLRGAGRNLRPGGSIS